MSFRLFALALILPFCAMASAWGAPPAPVTDLGVIDEIHGADGGFDYAAVDPGGRRLYVARGDGVMSVELATAKMTPTLVPGKRVHGVVPLPGGRLLSTNGDLATATLSDIATGKILAQVPTGKNPDAAIYDAKSGLVFVMDGAEDGEVTLVDPATGKSPGHIAVGGKLEFAVADGAGHLYVNIENTGEIAVLDTAARKVSARFALPGCEEPTGLNLNPDTHILLSVCRNQKAVALHAENGSVVAQLDIDRGADAVIFDARRKVFFVPCGRDGTLVAIGETGGKLAVIRKIPTAIGARTGALDPETGRLYLPTADAAGTDHQLKAGTFRILVVDGKRS
ncbi:MAG: gluconolactonase [Rhodospirillales bacterium]|nr:gluconolactonase [Rhodospirillales bacterium]